LRYVQSQLPAHRCPPSKCYPRTSYRQEVSLSTFPQNPELYTLTALAAEKWEYAYYAQPADGSEGGACSWNSPDGNLRAEKMEQLIEKLGAPKNDKGPVYLTLLNAIGAKGWELVCIRQSTSKYGGSEMWIFRRPATDRPKP
jgi:hypothetical protein